MLAKNETANYRRVFLVFESRKIAFRRTGSIGPESYCLVEGDHGVVAYGKVSAATSFERVTR